MHRAGRSAPEADDGAPARAVDRCRRRRRRIRRGLQSGDVQDVRWAGRSGQARAARGLLVVERVPKVSLLAMGWGDVSSRYLSIAEHVEIVQFSGQILELL